MKGIKTQEVLPLIKEFKGNLAAVARRLGVSRSGIGDHVERHAILKDAVTDEREAMKDHAESVLYSRVLAGETTELIFFLKTQCYDRGYGDRSKLEHTGEGGGPVRIVHIPPKMDVAEWESAYQVQNSLISSDS